MNDHPYVQRAKDHLLSLSDEGDDDEGDDEVRLTRQVPTCFELVTVPTLYDSVVLFSPLLHVLTQSVEGPVRKMFQIISIHCG